MREDTQPHLSQPLKNHHPKQMVEETFSTTSVSDRSLFDQVKVAGYVAPGATFMSPSPTDITPTPSDEILPSSSSQLTSSTVMPVRCYIH